MKKLYPLIILFYFLLSNATAQVSLNTINTAYNQDFNSLTFTTDTSSVLPVGWRLLESGTNGNTTYIGGTGSSNAGNTYSFGPANNVDRAFGGLQSGSLIPTIGASFINQTGTTITSLQVTYKGEQWRLGAAGRTDRLDFQYSTNATTLNSGSWTDVNNLDFTGPVTTGTTGALNGNLIVNSTVVSFTIDGLTIENDSTFFIRWTDFNSTGADDGLGIDDFTILPIGLPPDQPAISFSPASLAFGDVNTGATSTLQYEATGANLESPIAISIANPLYSLSVDGVSFSSSDTLPENGGQVFVRFAPVSNGAANTLITHTSGDLTESFPVTGSGFEQASNIIPIAEARTKSVGTKVTVAGRITVANEQGSPAYIQDASGGIPVFDFTLANGVSIGDSVIVTGPIGVFNDQKQISGAGIFYTRIETAPRIITPKSISLGELAANEGLLVTVQNVELLNKSFVFYPQSTERIADGTTEADLRIDGDTNIPGLAKPLGTTNITGVVGRFRTNAQLLPRFQQDIPGAVEPTAPSDNIPKNKTLDVVAWNLEFFGAKKEDYPTVNEFGPEDEALQLQNVKRVLDSLNADIIAVEEVSDETFFASLVAQLPHHAYTCSQRYSYSFQGPSNTFPPQKVCFIYDTQKIEVLGARAMFESRYDSARLIDPSLLPGYPGEGPSSFYSSGRLPYLLTVNATIEGVTEKINLIVIHAKSGDDVGDHSRRLYDATVLKDSLDTHFSEEKVIILGDLNDDLDESIATGLPSPYAAFVDDTVNYSPLTKVLSDAGARSTVSFGDVIDHQLTSNELNDEYLEGSAQIIAPFRFISNYAGTTSDHLPVITRYSFIAPVAQFAVNSISLTEDSTSYVAHINFSKPLSRDQQLIVQVSGDATAGSDYSTTPTVNGGNITLDLLKGDTQASFLITIVNDNADELAETISFTLYPAPCSGN